MGNVCVIGGVPPTTLGRRLPPQKPLEKQPDWMTNPLYAGDWSMTREEARELINGTVLRICGCRGLFYKVANIREGLGFDNCVFVRRLRGKGGRAFNVSCHEIQVVDQPPVDSISLRMTTEIAPEIRYTRGGNVKSMVPGRNR
jgi:hypothetical protein